MMYCVFIREKPDVTGLNRTDSAARYTMLANDYIQKLKNRFPEITDSDSTVLGVVFIDVPDQCAARIKNDIEKEFNCIVLSAVLPMELIQ